MASADTTTAAALAAAAAVAAAVRHRRPHGCDARDLDGDGGRRRRRVVRRYIGRGEGGASGDGARRRRRRSRVSLVAALRQLDDANAARLVYAGDQHVGVGGP